MEVNHLSNRPSRTWYLDENIGKQTLIKVKIKPTVTNYIVGSTTYLPGDTVEVPEENFSPDFMEKVEPEPTVEEESTPEPVEEPAEAPTEPEEPLETPTETEAKPVTKKRKRRSKIS